MRVADLAEALPRSIRSLEARPELLDGADEVLDARGHLKAFRKDMEKARYPKKVRELKGLEDRAVKVQLYSNHNIHGLLQTPEYAQSLFEMTLPPYSKDLIERGAVARMARNGRGMIHETSAGDVSDLNWFKSSYSSNGP
jgi:hypothetical protein